MTKKERKERRIQKQTERIKSKKLQSSKEKLEFKVKYEQMIKLAEEFNVSYDEIKCGRLRQPINLNYERKEISGDCCLDFRRCVYNYPKKECPYKKKV